MRAEAFAARRPAIGVAVTPQVSPRVKQTQAEPPPLCHSEAKPKNLFCGKRQRFALPSAAAHAFGVPPPCRRREVASNSGGAVRAIAPPRGGSQLCCSLSAGSGSRKFASKSGFSRASRSHPRRRLAQELRSLRWLRLSFNLKKASAGSDLRTNLIQLILRRLRLLRMTKRDSHSSRR